MKPGMQWPRLIVAMGVSGSGKTWLARELSAASGAQFVEADDFHPPENVARMRRGEALTDAQRAPWIDAIAGYLNQQLLAGQSCVLAYSGLRRGHRAKIRAVHPSTLFLHLEVPLSELRARLQQRQSHFMPHTLLESQFEALQAAHNEPDIIGLDGSVAPPAVLSQALAILRDTVDD